MKPGRAGTPEDGTGGGEEGTRLIASCTYSALSENAISLAPNGWYQPRPRALG